MKTFETRSECSPVEAFIWGKVVTDYGDFSGIRQLSIDDLNTLKQLINYQMVQLADYGRV